MTKDKSGVSNNNHKVWLTKPTPGHMVQFYQSDQGLIPPLAEFIGSGLLAGDTCIVIARLVHAQDLNKQLQKIGIDIAAAQKSGQYTTLDARETLEKFMRNDMPDREMFFAVIGQLVAKSTKNGKPLRAYGEMVALLWEVGNRAAVIELENLWNELAETYAFSLYCAYPELHFVMHPDVIDEIHECHNISFSGLVTTNAIT